MWIVPHVLSKTLKGPHGYCDDASTLAKPQLSGLQEKSWLHGGKLRPEGTHERVLVLMPLATAWVSWLSSRKLSVESNGFDFLGQLTMAGYLVFGACWSCL